VTNVAADGHVMTYHSIHPRDWTIADVSDFLADIDMKEYVDLFTHHKINGKTLIELNDDLLSKELKMESIFHRKHLLREIGDHVHQYEEDRKNAEYAGIANSISSYRAFMAFRDRNKYRVDFVSGQLAATPRVYLLYAYFFRSDIFQALFPDGTGFSWWLGWAFAPRGLILVKSLAFYNWKIGFFSQWLLLVWVLGLGSAQVSEWRSWLRPDPNRLVNTVTGTIIRLVLINIWYKIVPEFLLDLTFYASLALQTLLPILVLCLGGAGYAVTRVVPQPPPQPGQHQHHQQHHQPQPPATPFANNNETGSTTLLTGSSGV